MMRRIMSSKPAPQGMVAPIDSLQQLIQYATESSKMGPMGPFKLGAPVRMGLPLVGLSTLRSSDSGRYAPQGSNLEAG